MAGEQSCNIVKLLQFKNFMISTQDKEYLKLAIEQAKKSVAKGGFPAGAIVVKDGEIIGRGVATGNLLHDPTSHDGIASIRDACSKLATTDITGATMYCSLQPCLMCFSASLWAGISTIIYECGQDKVSPEYYTGTTDMVKVSQESRNPIELIHVPEMEQEALDVVKGWEEKMVII